MHHLIPHSAVYKTPLQCHFPLPNSSQSHSIRKAPHCWYKLHSDPKKVFSPPLAYLYRNVFSFLPHPRCPRETMHQRLRRMPRDKLLLWLCPLISSQCHSPRPIWPCLHHSHRPRRILSNMGDTGSFFSWMFV